MEYPDTIVVIEPGPAVRLFTVNRLEDKVWIVNRTGKNGAIYSVSVEPLSNLPTDIREKIDSAQDGFNEMGT